MLRVSFLLALLFGCNPPLGSDDVLLTFESRHPLDGADVGAVRARLLVHKTRAEITRDGPDRIRVLLEARRADDAVKTLTQPRGLEISGDEIFAPRTRTEGKSVFVSLTPPQLERVLAAKRIEIAWATHVFWTGAPLLHTADGELEIPAGTEITAYSRARDQAKLFATPPLPQLSLASREPQPIDWPLLLACLGLPLAVAIGWMFFVRRFDRARPEPWWLILATVAIGAAMTPIAAVIEHAIRTSTPYLDHTVMSLDLSPRAFPLALVITTLCIGVVEEGLKLLAAWGLAMHRREFDEPIDGIVFATAAAIGFATAENVLYFTQDRLSGGLFAVRSLTCVSGHFLYAAIWGYALGQRIVNKRARVLPYFLLAALIHGAWDTIIPFEIRYVGLALMVVCTILFTVFVRRALRWGVIEKLPSGEREMFRVGRRGGFFVAIVAMFAFVWQLETIALDAGHGRLTIEVVAYMAGYGTMFIVAAWALTAMIPLDAVLDDTGLTFAGALRRWSAIRGVTRHDQAGLVLATDEGELRLGPGEKQTIDLLEAAIRKRL